MKLRPISEQVVVVMGASSGIGRLTALEFARRGAKVVVASRNEEALNGLVAEIQAAGGQAHAVAADISVPQQVQAVAEAAEAHFGGIDTWVNNAGAAVYAPFEETDIVEFQRIINVNLLGYIYGAKMALPALRRRGGGALINIGSVESRVAVPYHSAYAASKHGILGFADALRIELKKERAPISVTNILPASINTPFFDHARTRLGVKPKGMRPIYQPEQVVGAVVYAANHRIKELVVGGAGRALMSLRALSPVLTDNYMAWAAFEGQKTDEPKNDDDSHALFAPVPGDRRVKQEAAGKLKRIHTPGFLARNPLAKNALFITGGLLALRAIQRARA